MYKFIFFKKILSIICVLNIVVLSSFPVCAEIVSSTTEAYYSQQINGATDKKLVNMSDYYDYDGETYIRNDRNSNAGSYNNIPLIYTEEKYTLFTLQFAVTFSKTNRNEQWLWITLGEADKTVNYSEQKTSGMAVIGLIRPQMTDSSNIVNFLSNSWSNAVPNSWPTGPTQKDGTATYDIKIVVSGNGKALIYWNDSEEYYTVKLDSSYNGGYVGIGTGFSGVSISDIEINEIVEESDDFGTFVSSPAPIEKRVKWYYPTVYYGNEKKEKYFSISLGAKDKKVNLYLSFPSVGGFRLSNTPPYNNGVLLEDSAIFEPESNKSIEYVVASNGDVKMISPDGTTVKFCIQEESWGLEIYSNEGFKVVSISPSQIAFGYSKSEAAFIKTYIEMPLSNDECIYGTGERFNGVNQTGKRTMMWNTDSYDSGSDDWRGYKNIPIVHSSKGYSLFYNSTCCATVDIGYTNAEKYFFDFSDGRLDLYLWTGTVLENIQKFTDLTGKSILPPKWAFQYQAGGSNNFWRKYGTTEYGGNLRLKELINSYNKMKTPINVVYGETIIPDSSKAYNTLNNINAKLLKWNCADLDLSTAVSLMPEISESDLPYVLMASNPLQRCSVWLDYTNSAAIELRKRQLNKYIKFGCRGGMLDFAELIPYNSLFSNGLTGDRMHNFYTYFYAKAYHDIYKEAFNGDHLTYIRGASAGTQKWSAIWAGDQSGTWDGLKKQISAGLSVSTAGFSVWGFDIGGLDGKISDELYCRSLEFAVFSPLMRSSGNESKLPTDYGEKLQNTYKKVYWLRENLLNKIYSSAIKSSLSGVPMMQAMGVAFPNENWNIDDQYIFCEDFLVCPVSTENTYYRNVTFPEGNWYDLWSGKKVEGEQTITVDAPYDAIPVYIKSGSVIPVSLGSDLELCTKINDSAVVDALIITPPDKDRTNIIYSDINTNKEYKNNILSSKTFRISHDGKNNINNVIAYGVTAYDVTVDGITLSRLNEKPTNNKTVGYYVSDNKTYIYLSDNWENLNITLGKEKNQNLIKSFVQENANVIIDDDFSKSYSISDSGLTAILCEKTEINSVTFKWTSNFADGYTIQTSIDGENWVTAAIIDSCRGGIDKVYFDETVALYLRVVNLKYDTNAPAIYAMEINTPINTIHKYYEEEVYFSKQINGASSKEKTEITDYYTVQDATYIRNNDSITTNGYTNVPMIYFGKNATTFSLEFDVKFSENYDGEQWVWISMGEKDCALDYSTQKTTGMALIGLVCPSTLNRNIVNITSNSWTNIQRNAWPGGPNDTDVSSYHHVKLIVQGNGKALVYWDNSDVCYTTKLDTSYTGGFVGIGSGNDGVKISNVELFIDIEQDVYISKQINGATDKEKVSIRDYYNISGNTYTRKNINSDNGNFKNVALIYTDRKYSTFTMSFDVVFSSINLTEQWIWVSFGEKEKNKNYIVQKISGASLIGFIRPDISNSEIVDLYSNAWTNAYPNSWPSGPKNASGISKHHIEINVYGDGKAIIYWDYDKTVYYTMKLDALYKNGFIGIGTGSRDVTISNIEIKDHCVFLGDVNYDNKINILDFISLKKSIANSEVYFAEADLKRKGTASNAEDLNLLVKYLLDIIKEF